MREEFNLSDKEIDISNDNLIYRDDDVKEFIRLLKREFIYNNECLSCSEFINKIDELAGEKLI